MDGSLGALLSCPITCIFSPVQPLEQNHSPPGLKRGNRFRRASSKQHSISPRLSGSVTTSITSYALQNHTAKSGNTFGTIRFERTWPLIHMNGHTKAKFTPSSFDQVLWRVRAPALHQKLDFIMIGWRRGALTALNGAPSHASLTPTAEPTNRLHSPSRVGVRLPVTFPLALPSLHVGSDRSGKPSARSPVPRAWPRLGCTRDTSAL